MAALSTCCFFRVTPTKTHHSIIFSRKPSCRIHSLVSTGCISKNLVVKHRRSNRTSSGYLVRASSTVDFGVKPGGIVECDRLPCDVRKRAMDAIDALGKRVTVGDVASKAGLQLSEAQRALQALAADTNGFLEVSNEGDVLYVFPKAYRSNLMAKSFRMKVEPLLEKGKDAGEYLVRFSFGTTLIASILIVCTAIIAILSSTQTENKDNRGSSFNLNPTDLFVHLDPSYYRRGRVCLESGRMNFVESIFSFVFGDGDPNQQIEEERWKLIGQYISSNGGVVAAEQITPFLDVETDDDDESYILPVLLRFDGQPQVDDKGNILYQFPSLQRTAITSCTDWNIVRFLQEYKWEFSKASSSQKDLVVVLGGINLFGVIILGNLLKTLTVSQQSSFISFVSNIFPLLQIYAASFVTIPLIRWFLLLKRNATIEKKNQAREKYAKALEHPNLSLQQKLRSARDMAQKTFIGQDRIVYSTEKDLYEQDIDAQQWEQRFQKIGKSK